MEEPTQNNLLVEPMYLKLIQTSWIRLLVLGAFLLASPAMGRPDGPPPGDGPGGPERMGGGRLERLVEKLDLEEETRVAVDEVLDASRLEARGIRRELREAHASMRALLENAQPDEAQIFAQVDVISALQGQREKNRLGTLIKVRALLSEGDREQLLGMMKRGPRRGAHRDRPARQEPDR